LTVTLALPDLPLAVCVKEMRTGLLVKAKPLIFPLESTETSALLLVAQVPGSSGKIVP
jgi:hypothetical protein